MAPLSLSAKLVFAAPAFALAAASILWSTYQTKFYVDDLRMPPHTFALANALVRSVDLFSYPLAGWLVDNVFVAGNPFLRGRRKPFLLVTAPIAAAAYFLLFSAPPSLPIGAIQLWFTLVAIVYNAVPLSLTYFSLGSELTPDYDEQARCGGEELAARTVIRRSRRAAAPRTPPRTAPRTPLAPRHAASSAGCRSSLARA